MSVATDELLATEEQFRREQVKRAIAGGGLPTEAEIIKAESAIRDAFNEIYQLATRLDGMTSAVLEELPFAVTVEHVGLVAGFTKTLDIEIAELRQAADTIEAAVGELDTIRRDQKACS
jgi:hypothetical protein